MFDKGIDQLELAVCFGSQTGQSESIANILYDQLCKLNFLPRILTLNEFQEKVNLKNEILLIIICSSTGDGEPPDNAKSFIRFINNLSPEDALFSTITFALLGIGDSNYSTFQGTPRCIEKNLLRLGAKKFIETGVADDQIGLELIVEPWIHNLLLALKASPVYDTLISGATKFVTNMESVQRNEMESLYSEMFLNSIDSIKNKSSRLKISDISFPDCSPCLLKGEEKLSTDESLRVPIPTMPYLLLDFSKTKKFNENHQSWQNGCEIPGATGKIYSARVVGTFELTDHEVAKPKREICLQLGEKEIQDINYMPGDAFYFIIRNSKAEVEFILERLNLIHIADQECYIRVDPSTTKRNASLPKYIPTTCSLRYIFTYCVDFRRVPNRPLLRLLSDCASNENEKRRLLELCSVQGLEEFDKFVRQACLSVIDLLINFPSCYPSAVRLIELLPRLLPRPYSVACTKGRWNRRLRFAYSLLRFPAINGCRFDHHGVATDFLNSLKIGDSIEIAMKEASNFRFPNSSMDLDNILKIPLLLIGTGTGVAPFLSFFHHLREKQKLIDGNVERMLYFGCRDLNTDWIYRNEMEKFLKEGIISELVLCESQPKISSDKPKYVQDALRRNSEKILNFISEQSESEKSVIYICGDVKHLSKDIWDTFVDLICIRYDGNKEDAKTYLLSLKRQNRYIEDAWA